MKIKIFKFINGRLFLLYIDYHGHPLYSQDCIMSFLWKAMHDKEQRKLHFNNLQSFIN